MTTTPQPTARRILALFEEDFDSGYQEVDERTGLRTDDNGDVAVTANNGYIPLETVLDGRLLDVITDLPEVTHDSSAQSWGRAANTRDGERYDNRRSMAILDVSDTVPDEHLLADIRTLVAAYMARKRPTSPAHAALERIAEEDGVLPDDLAIIRAALDKAVQA